MSIEDEFDASNPQTPDSTVFSKRTVAGQHFVTSNPSEKYSKTPSLSSRWKEYHWVLRLQLILQQRLNILNLAKMVIFLSCCWGVIYRFTAFQKSRKLWLNSPISYIHRQCPSPHYEVMSPEQSSNQEICITSLTDVKSPSWIQRIVRRRNFDALVDLTLPNKLAYAKKHGYRLFDQSHLIDTTRPPAWSKIMAVLDLFSPENHCDWVMWTDADSIFMNDNIRITDFLPSNEQHDLVVTSDKGGGYNSGVFLFRNSLWSLHFLEEWWNMRDFVLLPGGSLSGDNNAFKHLLSKLSDFDQHVVVPPRCTMNSFAKFIPHGEVMNSATVIEQKDMYMSEEHYHKGDFIAHAVAIDNKVAAIKLLLQLLHDNEQLKFKY